MSSEQQRALDLAYRALNRRERTVFELRGYLEDKLVEPDEIDRTVGELEAAGFLDDARFAQLFAEDKRSLGQWGSERISRDLARRGVAPDLIEAALGGHGREDELAAAISLLAARVPEPPVDDRSRDRAWRMLVRKGYEPELAYDALRAYASRHAA